MPPKLFLTGVTGYIAGDALYAIYNEHPDYDYACLVRTKDKAEQVKKAYPTVRIVLGGLDDSQILEDEASKADIVLHAADASDHEGAAKAIAAGLVRGHTADRPGYWLHTGGTGILTYDDSKNNFQGLGKLSDKEYNDLSGVDELTHLPDEAFHRNVDKLVLEAGIAHGGVLKTIIVCPPTIYGKGRGPVSGRGRQVYELAKLVITKQYIPIIGEGKSRWNHIHIEDLSDLFRLLVNKAVAGDTDQELWGSRGYVFAENGEHVWGDLARHVAKEAERLGYVKNLKEGSLGKDKALEEAGFEAVSWGLNSRGRAERGRRFLNWKPSRPSIESETANILKEEHQRLTQS